MIICLECWLSRADNLTPAADRVAVQSLLPISNEIESVWGNQQGAAVKSFTGDQKHMPA